MVIVWTLDILRLTIFRCGPILRQYQRYDWLLSIQMVEALLGVLYTLHMHGKELFWDYKKFKVCVCVCKMCMCINNDVLFYVEEFTIKFWPKNVMQSFDRNKQLLHWHRSVLPTKLEDFFSLSCYFYIPGCLFIQCCELQTFTLFRVWLPLVGWADRVDDGNVFDCRHVCLRYLLLCRYTWYI